MPTSSEYNATFLIGTVERCPLQTLAAHGTVGDEMLDRLSAQIIEQNGDGSACTIADCNLAFQGLADAIANQNSRTLDTACRLDVDKSEKQ